MESLEIGITRALQGIDVCLAETVATAAALRRATQSYCQAISTANRHLQVWTSFFANQDRFRQDVATSKSIRFLGALCYLLGLTYVSAALFLLSSGTFSTATDPQSPVKCAPIISSFTSPETNDTQSIDSSAPSTLISPQLTCTIPSTGIKEPDFKSPRFSCHATLSSDVLQDHSSIPAMSLEESSRKSALDLDMSFISSLNASYQATVLEPSMELNGCDQQDVGESGSFRVATPSQKLPVVDNSHDLLLANDEPLLVQLDFDLLPTVYRSGSGKQEITELYNCLRSSNSPMTTQSLMTILDQPESMLGLLLDILQQRSFVRYIMEEGQRKWTAH